MATVGECVNFTVEQNKSVCTDKMVHVSRTKAFGNSPVHISPPRTLRTSPGASGRSCEVGVVSGNNHVTGSEAPQGSETFRGSVGVDLLSVFVGLISRCESPDPEDTNVFETCERFLVPLLFSSEGYYCYYYYYYLDVYGCFC